MNPTYSTYRPKPRPNIAPEELWVGLKLDGFQSRLVELFTEHEDTDAGQLDREARRVFGLMIELKSPRIGYKWDARLLTQYCVFNELGARVFLVLAAAFEQDEQAFKKHLDALIDDRYRAKKA